MSAFEVTNDQYTTFLMHLAQANQTAKYALVQVDTAQWMNLKSSGEPFMKYYHKHPAYRPYPVVNVSHTGAELYCEWLTQQYNADKARKFKKVKFCLPTKDQWIMAAKGGIEEAIYPWEGNELRNRKGLMLCNFVREAGDTMGVAGYLNDNADLMAPSKSYWPNKFGLYNMSGNVAEMIAEKGKTMGGSWLDEAEAMKIESVGKYSTYDTPQPTIGFRYAMIVVER
jgi:formylglycine-generating enzyme required for sulfatase activity